MNTFLLISSLALWLVVLFLSFLLLGGLRGMGLLRWRLEQLEATTPSRMGRSGLKVGKTAPDFILPRVTGGEVSLHDFAGRRLLLVFTQASCGPCQAIMPELNRLGHDEVQVVVVNNGDFEATRQWAAGVGARMPVLVQERLSLSRRYEVFATPFAFLIDAQGVITSKGIINKKQHIDFVLSGVSGARHGQAESDPSRAEDS